VVSDPVTHTGTAGVVARAWCAVLGRSGVGTQDNFFDLGGHSLMLAQVAEWISVELSTPVRLVTLFEYPTVAALAAHLDGQARPDTDRVADRMARRKAARARLGETSA
jgi:hypothetical protein